MIKAPTARQRWSDAVAQAKVDGLTGAKAVFHANKNNPGLRESMLAEANGTATDTAVTPSTPVAKEIPREPAITRDSFWDGVFAKAHRKEQIKARVRREIAIAAREPATPKAPAESATVRWGNAIAQAKASGMPNSIAVGQVNRANPGLRDAMLAEVNA